VDRVQAWRVENPGYWRKPPLNGEPLQEMIRAQPDDPIRKSSSLPLQEMRAMQVTDPMGQNRGRLTAKVIATAEYSAFARPSTGNEIAKMIFGVGGRESDHVIAGIRTSPIPS
jgi:hypothetical protein